MSNPHAAQHRLDHLEVKVSLPTRHGDEQSTLVVHGRSSTKRTDLWTYMETFDNELAQEKGYSLGDALHHIVLVCVQDSPNSLERLNFALSGGLAYAQDPLF